MYARRTRYHARSMMPDVYSTRCHVTGRSHSDELWQLRTAASNQPYAVCAACQSKSQIQLQKSKPSTLQWTPQAHIEVADSNIQFPSGFSALRTAPRQHCAKHHCCHLQPRREQRQEHGSHCTVKNHLHSCVAMEALEDTSRWPPKSTPTRSRNSEHAETCALVVRSPWSKRECSRRTSYYEQTGPSFPTYMNRLPPVCTVVI